LLGQVTSFRKEPRLVVQESCKLGQASPELNRIRGMPNPIDHLAVPGLCGLRPTSFLAEQSELAPEMSSGDMIAGPFPELGRLPVMAFRLVPLTLRVEDPPKLMQRERFQGRLSNAMKQGKRCLIAHQRLFLPTFRQGQGTEVTLVYALAPKVA
jgi:hypothetical protein